MKSQKIMALTGIILLVLTVIVTGALFSGIIYPALGANIIPFHKFIGHITLLIGIISCFIYLKIIDIPLIMGFGFNLDKSIFLREMLTGWLFGLLIIAILVATYLVLGIYIIEQDLELSLITILKLLFKGMVTGFVVAIIEESIFRGALFSGLEKKTGPAFTILATSLLYASVHYLKYRSHIPDDGIHWLSGVSMIPGALYRFSDPAIIDSFLTLGALGILLSITRLKTGNIAMAIGIHAGIVMAIRISGEFTDFVQGNNLAFLVNKYDHLRGILALCWLTILSFIYYRLAKNGPEK